MKKHNINRKEREKRAFYGIAFTFLTLYIWLVLEVNRLTGLYWLILTIPTYLAILAFLESWVGHCVLKDKDSELSRKLHLTSVAIAVLIVFFVIFVLLPNIAGILR